MEKDLSNIRQNFQKNALLEDNTSDNPMELFRDWYLEAENEEPGEANTLTISTVGSDLQPSNRVVCEGKILHIQQPAFMPQLFEPFHKS